MEAFKYWANSSTIGVSTSLSVSRLLNPRCVESLEGVLWGEVEGLKRELFR